MKRQERIEVTRLYCDVCGELCEGAYAVLSANGHEYHACDVGEHRDVLLARLAQVVIARGAQPAETGFEYLLNALEAAIHSESPYKAGYPACRKALLDYVAALPSALLSAERFDTLWHLLCELPDRNSPEDDPNAIVCDKQELRDCFENAFGRLT